MAFLPYEFIKISKVKQFAVIGTCLKDKPNKYNAHSKLFTIPLLLVNDFCDFNAIFSTVFHYYTLFYAFSPCHFYAVFLLPRETFPSCVSSEVIHNNYSLQKCKNFPRSLMFVREKRVIDHWYP